MLDLQHLVSSSRADVQVFVGSAVNIDAGHFVWNKPRGVSMAYMIASRTFGLLNGEIFSLMLM